MVEEMRPRYGYALGGRRKASEETQKWKVWVRSEEEYKYYVVF